MSFTVIFGCGYHGRSVYRKVKKNKKLLWVDNDKKKHFKRLFGISIKPVSELKKIKYKKIIFSGRNIKEQLNQYHKLKLDKKKIIIWDSFKIKPDKTLLEKREKDSIKILKNITKIFSDNNIDYWVDLSGLLQLIRDGKISLLSDFDFSFFFKDQKKILKLFKTKKNYKVVKERLNKRLYKIFISGKNNPKFYEPPLFDFHFKIKKKSFLEDSSGIDQSVPVKYFKAFINYELSKEIKLRIPKSFIKYIEFLYGKSWRTRSRFFKEKLKKKNKLFFTPLDSN